MVVVRHRVMCGRRGRDVRVKVGRRACARPVGRGRREYATRCRRRNACAVNGSREVKVFGSRARVMVAVWRMHEEVGRLVRSLIGRRVRSGRLGRLR